MKKYILILLTIFISLSHQNLFADLNGDRKADFLWRHKTTGELAAWYMNGVNFISPVGIAMVDPIWELVGTPDLNGDGKPDFLWRHKTTGELAAWYMNGVNFISPVGIAMVDPSWELVSATPPQPGPNKVVFVTSVKGNGNLSTWADAGGKSGLAAGDAVCQARANAAGLTGTFVAWLSDSTSDAYCRIHNLTGKKSSNCGQASLPVAAGPWVRTDGFPFSEAIDQLINSNKVYTPIRFDEFGNAISSTRYFTATSTNGALHPNSAPSPCSDWTSSAAGVFVDVGETDGVSSLWTTTGGNQCDATLPLICFQTGAGPALPAFGSAGKKVFLSSATGNGNLASWPDAGGKTGLAAGDAICQARAAAAGFANAANFKAWISDSGTDARDRITSNGPWVRLDGVKVADTKADLLDGFLFTSLSLTETGICLGNYNVWTGTNDAGTSSCPCCTNWTDGTNGVRGFGGNSGRAGLGWSLQFQLDCDFTYSPLFCFED
jgi:hypothetical protein